MAEHTYPSRYPKGVHWATDAGWDIMDHFKPGIIPDDVRMLLAGYISGLVMKLEKDPKSLKREWDEKHGVAAQGDSG